MRLLFFLFLLYFPGIYASETIFVTADGIEKPIDKSVGSLVYFDEEDIDSSGATSFSELLRKTSGLSFSSNGGAGQNSNLFLRGTDSRHVLLIIDGVKYQDFTTPTGAARFEHLTLDGIKSIEVIKGPQSVLYGSSALGGVIRVTTKKGKVDSWLKLGLGSYDFRSFELGNGEKVGKITSNFSLNWEEQNSISTYNEYRTVFAERDPYSNLAGRGRVSFRQSEQTSYFGSIAFQSSDLSYDQPTSDDQVPQSFQRRNTIKLGGDHRLIDDSWLLEYSGYQTKINRFEKFSSSSDSRYKFDEKELNLKNTFFLSEVFTAVFGLEYFVDSFDVLESITKGKSIETSSIYGTTYFDFKSFFFDTGLRFDSFSAFDDEFTYRVGVGMKAGKLTIKASHSTGIKSPSLYQTYSKYGSISLKSESSVAQELTAILSNNVNRFEVSLFKTKFENYIDFSGGSYKNTNSVDIYGGEFSAQTSVTEMADLSMAISLLNARDSQTGKYLYLRPRKKIDFGTDLKFESWKFGLNAGYVGERNDVGGRLPSYLIAGLNLKFKMSRNASFSFVANNILDKRYEEKLGYGTYGRTVKGHFKYVF